MPYKKAIQENVSCRVSCIPWFYTKRLFKHTGIKCPVFLCTCSKVIDEKYIQSVFRLFVISLLTFSYFSPIISLFGAGAAPFFYGSGSGSGSGSDQNVSAPAAPAPAPAPAPHPWLTHITHGIGCITGFSILVGDYSTRVLMHSFHSCINPRPYRGYSWCNPPAPEVFRG